MDFISANDARCMTEIGIREKDEKFLLSLQEQITNSAKKGYRSVIVNFNVSDEKIENIHLFLAQHGFVCDHPEMYYTYKGPHPPYTRNEYEIKW
jgi:hypothetical protein